MIFGIEIG